MNIGPDVWGNAPGGESPVDEIIPWLGQLRDAANAWKPAIKSRHDYWEAQIDSLMGRLDALTSTIGGSVFLSTTDRKEYDAVNGEYQDLKDKLTLSPDFYLSTFQQRLNDLNSPLGQAGSLVEKLLAQLGALLRQLFGAAGVVIGGAIVIVLAYLYLTKRR